MKIQFSYTYTTRRKINLANEIPENMEAPYLLRTC